MKAKGINKQELRSNTNIFYKVICGVVLIFVTMLNATMAQVAINEDDSDGDSHVVLDVSSTTKGVIFPKLSETERNNLPSPATGLLIYNRTVGFFNYYNGTKWCKIQRILVEDPAANGTGAENDHGVGIGIEDPDNSAILHVNANNKGVLLPRLASDISGAIEGTMYYNTASNGFYFYNGTEWKIGDRIEEADAAGGSGTAEGMVIGASAIDASAKLELSSTDKGLLIPRLTDAERDGIESPAEGLLIYNKTDHTVQYFVDNKWYQWQEQDPTYGMLVGNPGTSAQDIWDRNIASHNVDDVYFIDFGSGAHEVYCDMSTNGGAWMLVFGLATDDGTSRHYDDATFWTSNTVPIGDANTPFDNDYKGYTFNECDNFDEIMVIGRDFSDTYQGYASYDLLGAYSGNSFYDLMQLSDVTISTARTGVDGASNWNLPDNPDRNTDVHGDPFFDWSNALQVNVDAPFSDATNHVRISTTKENSYNHSVQGGFGNNHKRGSWGERSEAQPHFQYCADDNTGKIHIYGGSGNVFDSWSQSNNATSGCGAGRYTTHSFKFTIFVR